MKIEDTAIPGVRILQPRRWEDARGWFMETWSRDALRSHGIDVGWVQDNHSMSRAAGTVRGLHFQGPPRAQAKLVRVLRGAVWDVAVDARKGSPTFGAWVGVELSAGNGLQLLVPEGCLHGFATREPGTEVAYKCSDSYAADRDGAVAWDDPDLAIDWGVAPGDAVLSDKDRAAPRWRDWDSPFAWEGAGTA